MSTPLTTFDAARNEKSHRFPVFLPGGKQILFLAQTAEGGAVNDESANEALDLASGKRTLLIRVNSSPLSAPSGHILFWRDGTLLAQAFDANALQLAGDPVPIATPVAFTQNEHVLASVSSTGMLVYREGARGLSSSLWLSDRNGIATQKIRDRGLFQDLALAHAGRRLAYTVNGAGQGATDLWIHDIVRGSSSRLTFEEGSERTPVWSRDDRFLYYSSLRRNDGAIFRRASDGTGAAIEVGTTENGIWPLDASQDGKWLAIGGVGAASARDILRFGLAAQEITPRKIRANGSERIHALSRASSAAISN